MLSLQMVGQVRVPDEAFFGKAARTPLYHAEEAAAVLVLLLVMSREITLSLIAPDTTGDRALVCVDSLIADVKFPRTRDGWVV